MAKEIEIQTTAGLNAYALVRDPASANIWQTTTNTFASYVAANVANYAIALTEQGTGAGYYTGDFPSAITTPGSYPVAVFQRLGGSPASTDTFLGDGIVPWNGASQIVTGEWWLFLFPGVAIMATVLAFNLMGDGLRDVLDPRMRGFR